MAARLFALLMELKLYSREWCSWCIDAKDFLRQRGYKFIEIDVGENRQAFEEMKELSAMLETDMADLFRVLCIPNQETQPEHLFLSPICLRPFDSTLLPLIER